jgi:hypothetical protein
VPSSGQASAWNGVMLMNGCLVRPGLSLAMA